MRLAASLWRWHPVNIGVHARTTAHTVEFRKLIGCLANIVTPCDRASPRHLQSRIWKGIGLGARRGSRSSRWYVYRSNWDGAAASRLSGKYRRATLGGRQEDRRKEEGRDELAQRFQRV